MFDKKYNYGFQEDSECNGIKRAVANLIVALITKPNETYQAVKDELGGVEFSAIYLLINESEKKLYIGESGNILQRIKSTMIDATSSIGEISYVVMLWDGRPNTTSFFNNSTLRKNIETRLIEILKRSEFDTANRVRKIPSLTHSQNQTATDMLEEIKFVLFKLGLIGNEAFQEINTKELPLEAIEEMIAVRTKNDWNKTERTLTIDDQKSYYRVGTDKGKWFQITVKHHFLNAIKRGDDGYFLFCRGNGYLVPLKEISYAFNELLTNERETLDIYVKMRHPNKAKIVVGDIEIDITEYMLCKIQEDADQ